MIPQDKKILVVDSQPSVLQKIEQLLSRAGYQASVTREREHALELAAQGDFDLILAESEALEKDDHRFLTELKQRAGGTVIVALIGSQNKDSASRLLIKGVEDYLTKPPDPHELRRRVDRILEYHDLRNRVVHLQKELSPHASRTTLVSRSLAMQQIHRQILQVAPTRSTVLILGESGVGKELVARALHASSPRFSRPFIPINCAAIPESLIENELFGHEKGAFTGAVGRTKGKFELAHQGTIFLDEIGEMNLNTQVKVLRILEEQEFMRVGGTWTVRVDARVVAATNSDLKEKIRQGRLREDLYYRLKVFTIRVPPLRERRQDIPELVLEFLSSLARVNNTEKKNITPDALRILMDYSWPGNVRELKNLLESLNISSSHDTIQMEDLPSEIVRGKSSGNRGWEPEPGMTLQDVERELITRTLVQTRGNRTRTARSLGIGIRTLQRKIHRYGIDPKIGH